jgi:signal transduction histidine kinase
MTHLSPRLTISSRWLSIVMLVFLQGALWVGVDSIWSRPLLLAHLGLFMLWQPLWRSEAKLSWGNSAFILILSLSALYWLNWWVLAFWVSGLFALVGGRVFNFHSTWQRAFYLFLMAYLLAVLLLYIVPNLFGLPEYFEVTNDLLEIGLPMLLLIMAVLPIEREAKDNVHAVDFIHVLLLFTLLTLVVLGSLAFMTLGRVEYLVALLRTLFLMGAALMVLGMLWNPRIGFSGLQASFSRYVLSIGTPLEEWLKQIALAAQQEQNPATFLERATTYLIEMPSIAGISWQSEEGHGDSGVSSQHRVELEEEDLVLTLFTHTSISPTVLIHMKLLIQVLGHFYQAKRRELRLREMTRQQTIYETGARLTHDLKNMLQSLFALTSVAQRDTAKAQPILQIQLPVLTQRIESLLTKLKAPGANEEENMMPLSAWWQSLRQRHQHRDIEWQFSNAPTNMRAVEVASANSVSAATSSDNIHPLEVVLPLALGAGPTVDSGYVSPLFLRDGVADGRHLGQPDRRTSASPLGRRGGLKEVVPEQTQDGTSELLIPATTFDSVLDNLIENACNKRLRELGIRISVHLSVAPFCLEICDSGSPVPESLMRSLMRTVVPSEDGLGVGLYQAARWAQQKGYRLALHENRAGKVCFEMRKI